MSGNTANFFTLEDLINLAYSFNDSGTSKILQVVLKILISQLNLKNTRVDLGDELKKENSFENVRKLKIVEEENGVGKFFKIEKVGLESSDERLMDCLKEKNAVAEMINLLNVSKRVDALEITMRKLTSVFDMLNRKFESERVEMKNGREESTRKSRSRSRKSNRTLPVEDSPPAATEKKIQKSILSKNDSNFVSRKSRVSFENTLKSPANNQDKYPASGLFENSRRTKSSESAKSALATEKTTSVEQIADSKSLKISPENSVGTMKSQMLNYKVPEVIVTLAESKLENQEASSFSEKSKSSSRPPNSDDSGALGDTEMQRNSTSPATSMKSVEMLINTEKISTSSLSQYSKSNESIKSEIQQGNLSQESSANENSSRTDKSSSNYQLDGNLLIAAPRKSVISMKTAQRESEDSYQSAGDDLEFCHSESDGSFQSASSSQFDSRKTQLTETTKSSDKASINSLLGSSNFALPENYSCSFKVAADQMIPVPMISKFAPCESSQNDEFTIVTFDKLKKYDTSLKEQIESINCILSENLFFLQNKTNDLEKRFSEDFDWQSVLKKNNFEMQADIKSLFLSHDELKRNLKELEDRMTAIYCMKVDKTQFEMLLDIKAEKSTEDKFSVKDFQETVRDLECQVIKYAESQLKIEENFKVIKKDFLTLMEEYEKAKKQNEKKAPVKKMVNLKKNPAKRTSNYCLIADSNGVLYPERPSLKTPKIVKKTNVPKRETDVTSIRCYIADKDGAIFRANPNKCFATNQ